MATNIGGMLAQGGANVGQQIGGGFGKVLGGIGGMLQSRSDRRRKEEEAKEVQNFLSKNANNPAAINAEGLRRQALQDPLADVFFKAAQQATTQQRGAGLQSMSVIKQKMQAETDPARLQELENALVAVARQTGQTDPSAEIGAAAEIVSARQTAEYEALNQQVQTLANQEKLGVSILEQFKHGSPEWNEASQKVPQSAVREATKRHNEREKARLEYEAELAKKGPLSPAEEKEMKDRGIPISTDPRVARREYTMFRKALIEKSIESAMRPHEPIDKYKAEAVVSYTLRELSRRYDYIDIFSDDVASVVDDLTEDQKAEIAGLVTDRSESEAVVLVEQWLRNNYPEAFERSEKVVEARERTARRREEALQDVFKANPDLDPNDPVDRRLAEEALDDAIGDGASMLGTPMVPATAY